MIIVWKQPNGAIAVTSIFDGSDPAEHAQLLQERGDIPADWVAVQFSETTFPSGPQESWIWDGANITVDPIKLKALQVPAAVTMRQARLALLGAGLLDQVDTAIAAATGTDGKEAQITWEYSSDVMRTNPIFQQLSAALGLTSGQIDDLFISAAKL